MAGFQPFDYGNAILKADQITGQRLKNAMAQRDLELGTAGVKNIGVYNPRDWTKESWVQAIDPRTGQVVDPSKLVRYVEPKQDRIVFYNGVPHKVSTTPGANTQPQPLTTLEEEVAGSGAVSEGKAFSSEKGKQEANKQFAPAAVTATTTAEQQVKDQFEIPRAGKIVTQQEEAKAEVKEKVEMKKREKAFNVYSVARDNLRNALKSTVTGFLAGRIPANTAAQQIAQNAKMIMLPALKTVVRESGEGVFTDADAVAVLALVPDRITTQEAIDPIFKNIDDFMIAKLGYNPLNNGNKIAPKVEEPEIDLDDPSLTIDDLIRMKEQLRNKGG